MTTPLPPRKKFKERFYSLFFLDFFSITPSNRITFLNKGNFSTKLGVLASWLVLLLTLFTFLNFGSNMIYHKDPKSIFSQMVTPDPENFELYPENLFFAFGLQDLRNKSQHYIDETIYSIQLIKRTKVGTNITLQYINISRCDIEQVPDIDSLKEYYNRNNINNLYCIKNYSEILPELKSTWDGALYKNILINVMGCKNSTPNSECKPIEVIQSYLNSANFAIYLTNMAVDTNNYEKPITFYGKQIYTPISATTLTYIEMMFNHLELYSDDGLLFDNLQEIKTVGFASSRQILTLNPNLNVQIDMKLDKIKSTYKRKYDTIQEVAANIGGVIQALMIIMKFLVLPLAEMDFRQKLANNLFHFDRKELNEMKENIAKDKYKNKKMRKVNVKPNNLRLCSLKNGNMVKETSSEAMESRKALKTERNEGKIEITYWEYICSCFKSQIVQTKTSLINKGLRRVDNTLDITYIMNKLVELDKIKALIFDKNQFNLFEYIPKPVIALNEDKKNAKHKITRLLKSTPANKEFLAEKSYKKIKEKKIKNYIDEKLIQMMAFDTENNEKLDSIQNLDEDDKNSKKGFCVFNEYFIIFRA